MVFLRPDDRRKPGWPGGVSSTVFSLSAVRRLPRAWRGAFFLAIALGGAATAAWVGHADARRVWEQARAFNWWLALPAAGLTLANILARLIRWQYFLRRAGIHLPARQSAGIFVAGLAMLVTPAYAGEGAKAWLVARAVAGQDGDGADMSARRTLAAVAAVVVAERLFDAVALALLGGVALLLAGEWAPGVVLQAGASAGLLAIALSGWAGTYFDRSWSRRQGRPAVAPASVGVGRSPVVSARSLAIALLLSLAAWLAGCATLLAVCTGAGITLGARRAIGTYALATLLGGLTMLPASVGVVGTTIVLRLEAYGASLQQAVLAAVLVRLFTVWLAVALGAAGCWRAWRHLRASASGGAAHFDALAPEYGAQLSPLARARAVGRKVAVMRGALAQEALPPGARLLDAGCGPGWYLAELRDAGYDVTGVDLAPGQLLAARAELGAGGHAPGALAAGSILDLPFANGTFDAAYAVNVLHHVGGRVAQRRALAEVARVVRPGGLVFVHEISTVNPLYRLYMVYLFPLWKRIDLGIEVWLDPRTPLSAAGLRLADVHHYTFLPDFTPPVLYRLLAPFETWLERSRLGRYAAHFTLVYRRLADAAPLASPTAGDATALIGDRATPPAAGGPGGGPAQHLREAGATLDRSKGRP